MLEQIKQEYGFEDIKESFNEKKFLKAFTLFIGMKVTIFIVL